MSALTGAMPTIVRADARALPLADRSVDLVVTSPPYFGLRSYLDGGRHYDRQIGSEATPLEFVDALIACTREMVRVLKPSGSLWINLGDKYSDRQGPQGSTGQRADRTQATTYERRAAAAGFRSKTLLGLPWRFALRCIDELGLVLRAEVIWEKPNGLPESVTDRVRRSHETWFHFTLGPHYFSAIDEIREPHRGQQGGRQMTPYGAGRHGLGASSLRSVDTHALGRCPGSVWEIATQPLTAPSWLGVDHFAAFPMEWPRRLVKGWCPPDGTVLDPFGGTGTTALVATMLGRRGISVDASADYCRLARWRCSDPGERAKAAQVAKPPPVPEGQVDLFGGAA